MGLYDDIKCKYPLLKPDNLTDELKDLDFNSLSFQTKDLDNCLSLFEIREDGTLWQENYETEYVPGDKNGKTFSEQFGCIKILKRWWEERKDTVTINFYEYIQKDNYKNDYEIEYVTVFVHGKLISLELLKFEYSDNAKRKDRFQKMSEEFKARDVLFNKWYIKYIYVPYSKIIRYIFKTYNKLKQKLPPSWEIERWFTPL